MPSTYSFNLAYYPPGESGVAYAAGYRLKSMGADDPPGGYNESVPLMIPANFATTFGSSGLDIRDNAFRLCFSCHDSTEILDDTPGDGLDTNFKASLPDPPRSYSYTWSDVEDTNQHFYHTINQTMQLWDSDWDTGTSQGMGEGNDSIVSCSSCHNVHGAAGAEGSTNEPMIRDGSLAGRTGFGFSYVVDGGYPIVTSDGASLPISVGAVFRNGNAMCSEGICHLPTPPGPTTTAYDATGSGSGTYLEYYRAPEASTCDTCHAYGTEASHPTHDDSDDSTGLKGVNLVCYDCHDSWGHVSNTVDFADGNPLSTTNACDWCHSPGGDYNGVVSQEESIGAKDNWETGVYDSQYQVLPFWQPETDYEPGDIVKVQPDEVTYRYVCIADFPFKSGTSPDVANWKLIDGWQQFTDYYVGDLVTWNTNVFRSRKGFSPTVPPYTPFTTGSSVVPANWDLVKRTGSGKESLKPGKEKWCAGCHDSPPANSKADGTGVNAPNIIGEGSSYGFYLGGHGRPGIDKECLDCHNSTFAHIDHEHRTYEVLQEDQSGHRPEAIIHSYKDSYRLKSDMAVPRLYPEDGEDTVGTAFRLCMNVCHDAHSYVFSDIQYCNTNFRPMGHQYHSGVANWASKHYTLDSDWDGIPGDSGTSCPLCHNPHGSPMEVNGELLPNPVMIRHGELISTPGSDPLDKVPAFDFRWGGYGGETNVLLDSRWGILYNDGWFSDNYICESCHLDVQYSRTPGGPEGILDMEIWTSDDNDEPKNSFSPGEPIHYHLSFYLRGPIADPPWCVKTKEDFSAAYYYPYGDGWITPIVMDPTPLPRGEHSICWDLLGEEEMTIPSNAELGPAKFYMELLMGNSECTELLDSELKVHDFTIVE
jgi:hypothetical protein